MTLIALIAGVSSYFIPEPILNYSIFKIPVMFTLIIWVWMIYDYFKRDNLKHKEFWGWSLLLLNLLAGLFYYLIVYFPQQKIELVKKL
jgi:hypothetical protein